LSKELLDRLENLDTCAVSDALDSLGVAGAVTGLIRRSTTSRISGRVKTVTLSAGKSPGRVKNHLGTRSIEAATEEDIIVVEQRSGIDAAGWGGLLAAAAKVKGIRGIIVEGPARDVDEFEELGLPVFSRSTTPRTARGRIYESAVNVAVRVGEITVDPSDFVIADGTGVVFIPRTIAKEVIERAEQITNQERLMNKAVIAGNPVTKIMGITYEDLLKT
jgi:regulator of RNase E activity RraA